MSEVDASLRCGAGEGRIFTPSTGQEGRAVRLGGAGLCYPREVVLAYPIPRLTPHPGGSLRLSHVLIQVLQNGVALVSADAREGEEACPFLNPGSSSS